MRSSILFEQKIRADGRDNRLPPQSELRVHKIAIALPQKGVSHVRICFLQS